MRKNGVAGRLDSTATALLETMVCDAPVAFAFYDAEARYQRISQALADLNHLPISAHLGYRPTEVLPAPLGRDAVEALVPEGVEIDFHEGGQPSWWWLLCAE